MIYNSTRDNTQAVEAAYAIAHGISKEGGLFVPQCVPALTKEDFKNIAVDFGEVLGPIMLMDKLKGDVKLSYPTGSNAKLFDYYCS